MLRNPLNILIVGAAQETTKIQLSQSIKRLAGKDAAVEAVQNSQEAVRKLNDNKNTYDAVYLTYDEDDVASILQVSAFAGAAHNSVRRKMAF